MLSFLLGLLGLLPSALKTVDGITNAISNQKIAAINAKTEEERIHAEENTKALEARRDVLVAEATIPLSAKLNALARLLLALGPILVLLKLLAWDKVIGSMVGCAGRAGNLIGCEWFTTDPLDTNQWAVIGAVVSFYLVTTWKFK